MPVLFDARTISPHYPGVGRYGQGLLSALAARHPAELCAVVGPGTSSPPAAGVRHIELVTGVRAPLDQVLSPRRLGLAASGPGWVYHSPFYLYPYFVPLPSVVTLYDLTPLLHPEGLSPLARLLFRLTHRLAIQRARCLITLSEAARADFVRYLGAPAGKITVVAPGHSRRAPGHSPPVPSAPSGGAAALPERFLLYVGINKPHKNLPRLVAAYRHLGAGAPPLLIAGPLDPRYPAAQAAAERAGLQDRVRFLGRVPEDVLARLYAQATLLTFPSLAEGFGFPVLEAMAHGLPVACSDIPVLRELAGEAAAYFDPHSPEQMAAVIGEALSHPDQRAAMAEHGRSRASAYTWEQAAAQTWQVYQAARPS